MVESQLKDLKKTLSEMFSWDENSTAAVLQNISRLLPVMTFIMTSMHCVAPSANV